jgi:drug/metabolite transporter (DMT)-like permease
MSIQQKAWLALITGVFAISTSPIIVKLAGIPGTSTAFYRVFIGCLVLIPWFLLHKPTLPKGKALWAIIAGGLFFGVDLVLWNESLLRAPATSATLMANNAPLWVGLASLFIFKEQLTRNYWIGLALAMLGMVVVAGGDLQLNPTDLTGIILALGASFCYAGYILSTRQARGSMDTVTFMVWSLAIASLVIVPFAVWLEAPLWGFSTTTWMLIIALGLFAQTIGWLAINYALGHLPASITSVTLLGQVIIAALLAVPLLGEPIRESQIIGGLLIIGGIILVNRR